MKNISVLFFVLLMLSSCGDSEQKQVEDITHEGPDMELAMRKGVIYEVNVRQFTPEGTFNAFSEHLPRLRDMGVDIVWLMPIHPIGEKNRKGELGSYYSIKDYKGINPEFGDEDDFRELVAAAHDLGMLLILDWVPNHTSWDAVWTETNPEFYVRENGEFIYPPDTDWTDVIQLDYDNPEMREAMIDAMAYWVTEFNIDGFRCDVAGFVPNDFWEVAIAELNEHKDLFWLAEWEDPTHHDVGFHASYAWELHHIMNRLAQNEANVDDLIEYWEKEQQTFPSDALRMVFIDNHDENSWNGTIEERMGANADAMAVFNFTFPGIPLIYTGEEAGLDFRLPFFEKSEVPWGDYVKAEFYTRLIQLKKENNALWNAPFGGGLTFYDSPDNVLVYSRDGDFNTVVVILNLDNDTQEVEFPLDVHTTTEFFSGERAHLHEGDVISVSPNSFTVWVNN